MSTWFTVVVGVTLSTLADVCLRRDRDGLLHGRDRQLKVQDRRSSRGERDLLCQRGKARLGDGQSVVTEGDDLKAKGSVAIGLEHLDRTGIDALQYDLGAGNRTVLRIMNNALDLPIDSGVGALN